MRYIFLIMNAALSVVLNNVLSPNIPIFGVELDLILMGLAGVIFFEGSLSSIWYQMIGIALMDMFFARTYGFYAFQYMMASLVFFLVTREKKKSPEIFSIGIASSYLVRELAGVLGCFLSDNPVNLFTRLVHVSLKGIVIHVLLGFLVYFIFKKAYELRAIRPTGAGID